LLTARYRPPGSVAQLSDTTLRAPVSGLLALCRYFLFAGGSTYFSLLNLNFLIGMAAYYGWVYGRPSWVKGAFPSGLALLVAVYVLESRGVPYNVLQLAYAAAFGLVIAGAAALESAGQWPSTAVARLLNVIGDASYSIYLTHLAFLGCLPRLRSDCLLISDCHQN
jgi:peptidoglycan/LPS O-acetylase OafA/YrhL